MRRRHSGRDVEITSLTAWSESQRMWPMARYHACNVLDAGDSIWNAGKYAPASICVKLTDGPRRVSVIELHAEMSPIKALVHHEIRAGLSPCGLRVVGSIQGCVSHGECLRVAVNAEVQFVEVATLASPSFVAWRRIRLFEGQ